MTDRKSARDIASDSPDSRVAGQQRLAGKRSGQQETPEVPPTEKQPRQPSSRRDAAREHEATVRKGYEAARNPEPQGDGDPGPEQISEQPSQQGHRGQRKT